MKNDPSVLLRLVVGNSLIKANLQRIRHSHISKLWAAGIPETHGSPGINEVNVNRSSYIRYSRKNDRRPLVAAVEAIDYGKIWVPSWLGGYL